VTATGFSRKTKGAPSGAPQTDDKVLAFGGDF
jgi:hypothetical protein